MFYLYIISIIPVSVAASVIQKPDRKPYLHAFMVRCEWPSISEALAAFRIVQDPGELVFPAFLCQGFIFAPADLCSLLKIGAAVLLVVDTVNYR